MRDMVLVFLTHNLALPMLQRMRKEKAFPYTMDELSGLNPGTLGHDLYQFITVRKLSLLPHYARHDIKHILLGYDTTGKDEVRLQCFMLGNRHVSFPVLATVIYGFLTMPEYWGSFTKAYRRGRGAGEISHWDWFAILDRPTTLLQNAIK